MTVRRQNESASRRKDRLRAALRANLNRRKQQARGRASLVEREDIAPNAAAKDENARS